VRRTVRLLLLAVAAVGVLLLFVDPARTLLQQDRQISTTERQIAVLQRENAVLRARAAALRDPAQVEQLARSAFGMVMPGQKAFAVESPGSATPSTTTPSAHHAGARP
jgi:cell division protein FtsB